MLQLKGMGKFFKRTKRRTCKRSRSHENRLPITSYNSVYMPLLRNSTYTRYVVPNFNLNPKGDTMKINLQILRIVPVLFLSSCLFETKETFDLKSTMISEDNNLASTLDIIDGLIVDSDKNIYSAKYANNEFKYVFTVQPELTDIATDGKEILGVSSNQIFKIDPENGNAKSLFKAKENIELNGLCIFNGKIYLTSSSAIYTFKNGGLKLLAFPTKKPYGDIAINSEGLMAIANDDKTITLADTIFSSNSIRYINTPDSYYGIAFDKTGQNIWAINKVNVLYTMEKSDSTFLIMDTLKTIKSVIWGQ
jgi:hypothetical protein